MTINAPAAILLLLYELVGEEQGVPANVLRGTVQNDILKEYAARGNFIYPPEGAMRLTTDIFDYCHKHIPKWNTISISGYHMREKGCSAVQEVAFTLSNAIAYVQAAIDAGLEVDEFAAQIAFFFNGHNNVFQEIAKFRAVRKMWAEIMRDRFGAQEPRSMMVRFHTQTGGSTLTAQQPENNIVRVALQGFAAVCGGTTRPSGCPPSTPPGSRSAPSRCSRTSRARRTRSIRSPAPITSSGSRPTSRTRRAR
jgi:methylmalonyl-CoA mutase, N-terminal domain